MKKLRKGVHPLRLGLLHIFFTDSQLTVCEELLKKLTDIYRVEDGVEKPPLDEKTFHLHCSRSIHLASSFRDCGEFGLEPEHPPTMWPQIFNNFLETIRADIFPRTIKERVEKRGTERI